MQSARLFLALALLGHLICAPADASVVLVPDEYSTIQSAIDAGSDTILVRDGYYPEVPVAYRGVTLLGTGARRPRLSGLLISNPYNELSRQWSLRGINFDGRVDIATDYPGPRFLEMQFTECGFDSGLKHVISGDSYDIAVLSFNRCRFGAASEARAISIIMQSDTVDAGVAWGAIDSLRAQNCWFRGGPGKALSIDGDQLAGIVEDCVFEDYSVGIWATDLDGFIIASNVIRRMSNTGIDVFSYNTVFKRNMITDCGVGVQSYALDDYFYDNTVLRMRTNGLYFWPGVGAHVEGNVIGRCGAAGITVRSGGFGNLVFLANTLYMNGGSGIELQSPFTRDNNVVAKRNIGFGNAGWGLQIGEPQQSVNLGCNDWFGNTMGDVSGAPLSSEDLLIDPLFCDLATDDVTLFAVSPLVLQQACGRIGARGIGCSPPILKALSVGSSRRGVGIEWDFEAMTAVASWIERADQAAGPWDSLGTGTLRANNSFELLDSAVAPDRGYYYRVAWLDRGTIVRGSPALATWNDAGRLSSVMPNPAYGGVTVDWVLARPGATEVRVYDLAGREVSTVARGSFGVGRHQVQWDGRLEGRGLAPAGMYVVRISHIERTTSHRILLLR